MPYTPTTWIDEIPSESPVKYEITDAGGGLNTIHVVTPITPGTPMNAVNLNKMESGIETAQETAEEALVAAGNAYDRGTEALLSSRELNFGNGADGDAEIVTEVTLNSNMNYNNLTIRSGGVLKPAGFVIKVCGTLLIESGGKISADGGNGEDGVYSASPAPSTIEVKGGEGSHASKYLVGFHLPSGSGLTTTGRCRISAGATMGTGVGSDGKLAGALPATPTLLPHMMAGTQGGAGQSVYASSLAGQSLLYFTGAIGGEGDNSYSAGLQNTTTHIISGGGGGGGGGCMHIFASNVNNFGTISAKGGNGGVGRRDDGTYGGNAYSGGGGGGGGGYVLLVYHTGSVGTIIVSGGQGGRRTNPNGSYWGTNKAEDGQNGSYTVYQLGE